MEPYCKVLLKTFPVNPKDTNAIHLLTIKDFATQQWLSSPIYFKNNFQPNAWFQYTYGLSPSQGASISIIRKSKHGIEAPSPVGYFRVSIIH